MNRVTILGIALSMLGTASQSEIRYYYNNKEITPTNPKIAEMETKRNRRSLKKYCAGAAQIEKSFSDLVAHRQFPLKNSVYPASDFVGGFLKIRSVGRGLGFYPQAYVLIWQNITSDGDKAFNRVERDNVVALWEYTKSWVDIKC